MTHATSEHSDSPLPASPADEERCGDDEEGGGGGDGDDEEQRQVEVAPGREENAANIVLEETKANICIEHRATVSMTPQESGKVSSLLTITITWSHDSLRQTARRPQHTVCHVNPMRRGLFLSQDLPHDMRGPELAEDSYRVRGHT